MMKQFEVITLRGGAKYLLMINNDYYDYVWGFYRPVRRLGD